MKSTKIRRTAALASILLLSATAGHAEVKLANLFQEGMVLQRSAKVPVWGHAGPGERVTLGFAGQTKTAIAGADGKWAVSLDPMPADATPKK